MRNIKSGWKWGKNAEDWGMECSFSFGGNSADRWALTTGHGWIFPGSRARGHEWSLTHGSPVSDRNHSHTCFSTHPPTTTSPRTHARTFHLDAREYRSRACTHAPVTCLTWAGQLRVSFTRWSLTRRQTFVCQIVMPLIFSSLNFWYFYSLSSLFCSSQTHSPAARDPYQYLS